MKKYSLFDHLNSLTVKKEEFDASNDAQAKSYTPYMINRFISMVDLYIPIVNEVNKFYIDKSVHYNYFKALLPKRKHYFRYIKAGKEYNQEEKSCVGKYFECGIREAERHIDVMSENQVKEILNLYNINN